ncbi:KAP family P-loop NTPase fold protein [Rahnella aceris]
MNKKSKKHDLDFDWDKEVSFCCDNYQETLSKDKLGRLKYAEYLYFYLKEEGRNNNTVINLNAEWGAGKTFFVKRMFNSLKDKHPCIYIDAWKQDFSDDAFITLFSSLITQIELYAGRLDQRLINIGSSIGRFTKGLIPEVLAGLAKEYAGVEAFGDISKKAAEIMLTEHQQKSIAMQELRKELSFWANLSFKKGFEPPVFIFIDELDRCRPDYAISLLEIVKHFFDIEKFVFIIATDTNQLQHSIKNLYGNDFAANDYLGRFFHRRFSLRAPDVELLVSEKLRERKLQNNHSYLDMIYPHPSTLEQFSKNLSAIFNAFNLNIRDVIRNVDRIVDMLSAGLFKKKIDYISLAMLMVIYEKDHTIIDLILNKSVSQKTFKQLLSDNARLNGFGLRNISLTLDSTFVNSGIRNFFRGNNNSYFANEFSIKDVSVTTFGYFEQFIEFMATVNSRGIRPKDDSDNPFLLISNNVTGLDMIKLHRGSIFSRHSTADIYPLQSYIDFIEMANSFE